MTNYFFRNAVRCAALWEARQRIEPPVKQDMLLTFFIYGNKFKIIYNE